MENLFGLLIIFAIVGVIALLKAFSSFKTQEIREKREVDLHLLALEDGAEFSQDGIELAQLLINQTLHLSFIKNEVTNVIRQNGSGFTSYIFDYSFNDISMDISSIKQTLEMTSGILIKFEDKNFPRFDIARKQVAEISGYYRIDPNENPSWLSKAISVYAGRHETDEIMNLVQKNRSIEELTNELPFFMMKFRGPYVAIYYGELLPSQALFYRRLKNRIETLTHLSDLNATSSDHD